jgi:hypothetical protein
VLTDPNYHFSECGSVLHGLERIPKILEFKDLADRGRQLPFLQPSQKLRSQTPMRIRLAGYTLLSAGLLVLRTFFAFFMRDMQWQGCFNITAAYPTGRGNADP